MISGEGGRCHFHARMIFKFDAAIRMDVHSYNVEV